jgi:hypothetical protein
MIIAYDRQAAQRGGWVALGDGSVRKVTAQEFARLKLAEPGK